MSIHQAQGQLCVCCVDFCNRSWLLVWILEDYGTNNWILKHVVDTWILKLILSFVIRSTEWLQFTQNKISFSLLGRIEHWLHMTWTAERFMSSIPMPSAFVDQEGVSIWSGLTIFLMFPYSWSH
jgi:hypothetical protein